jgi:hypothetical protein
MESELDLLLGSVINSLAKLELLLYFHAHPGTAQPPKEIGARLSRPSAEVAQALEELAQAGLVERFPLGTGRHVMFGSSDDPHVQDLIALLAARYRSPETRAGLVRSAMATQPDPGSAEPVRGSPSEEC